MAKDAQSDMLRYLSITGVILILAAMMVNCTIAPSLSNHGISGTPSAVYGSPSAVYGSPSAVYGSPSAVYGSPSAVFGTPSAVYGSPSAVYGSPSAVYGTPSAVYGSPSAVWGSPSAVYGSPSAVWGSPSAVWGSPSAVYGTPSAVYGSPSAVWGSPSAVYGSPSAVYGSPSAILGTYSVVSMYDSSLKYLYLPLLDPPVAPSFEGYGIINFTMTNLDDGNGYGIADNGFDTSIPLDAYIDYKGSSNPLSIQFDKLEYNKTELDGVSYIYIRGKFHLDQPLTNINLDPSDYRQDVVREFSFQNGELDIMCINTTFKTDDIYTNYEAYGRLFFYSTFENDDKVLIMDFSNQLDFLVPGLGDTCHGYETDKFHLEGDVFCYPSGYFMGWQTPLIWSDGDQVLYSGDTLYIDAYSDLCPPWFHDASKVYTLQDATTGAVIGSSGPTTAARWSISGLSNGNMIGTMTALTDDGYVAAMGYKHFNVTVTPFVESMQFKPMIEENDRTITASVECVAPVSIPAGYPTKWLEGLSYALDWGDGTTSEDVFRPEEISDGVAEVSVSHTYKNVGEYEVKFIIPSQEKDGKLLTENLSVSSRELVCPGAEQSQQMYVGIPGVGVITKSAADNYLRVRADFLDDQEGGIYTALIDWGDGTVSKGSLKGFYNRLVSLIGGEPYNLSISGKIYGGHVYYNTGTYAVRINVYKDGELWGSAADTVSVEKIDTFMPDLAYRGSWTDGVVDNVYYEIDWGDGIVESDDYDGGMIGDDAGIKHDYLVGGRYLVNLTFWYTGPPPEIIHSYYMWTVGCPEIGARISIFESGEQIVVMDGFTPVSSRDLLTSDKFNMSVDIPTNIKDGSELYAIVRWGDAETSTIVVPDSSGVVHIAESHVYTQPGMYSPRIELYNDQLNRIGVGYTGMLDLSPRLGPIFGPIDSIAIGEQVNPYSTLPFDPSSLGTYGTDWYAIWYWGDGQQSSGTLAQSGEQWRIEGSHGYDAAQQYTVRLDIVKDGNTISSSIFDHVEVG